MLGGTSIGIRNRVYAVPRRILAGHETGSTGGAVGGVGICIHEYHPFLGKPVDVRAFVVFRSHVAKVSPAKIVYEEKYDVGFPGKDYQR